MTKKKPRFGAIPKLNMPKRSHDTVKPTPRPGRSVVQDNKQQPYYWYKSFSEFCQRVQGLKSLKKWKIKTFQDRLVIKKVVEPFLLPEVEIMIDDSLGYTLKASGCFLPEDHPLYLEHRRSMRNISICTLVNDIENWRGEWNKAPSDFCKMLRQPGLKYLQALVTVYSCLHYCLKRTSNNYWFFWNNN